MDKVSVVLPVYKVEKYILNILDSIVQQTYKNVEVILVDDGTPDRSIEVAEAYLIKQEGIEWKVIHQKNSGLSAARNKGIEKATGDWVICPDSDDYIDPCTIERMMKAAKETNVDCVFCGYKSVTIDRISEKSQDDGSVLVYDNIKLKKKFLNREIILLFPGMLVKREKYKAIQFDTACPYDEDIHFLWRMLFLCDRFAYIPAAFYNYLSRSSSMVHTLDPEDYLKASDAYRSMTRDLLVKYPSEKKLIERIYPKYRLGGLHVLAKANDYVTFKKTALQDGYRKDMGKLVFYGNIRLSMYALLFCISLKAFYKVSR